MQKTTKINLEFNSASDKNIRVYYRCVHQKVKL